eukprot:9853470-Karenia_brevis.AAC.2
MEDFSSANQDIDGFRLCQGVDHIPPGIDRGDTYRFRELPAGPDMLQYKSEARLLAESEAIRSGDVMGGQSGWYARESIGNIKLGDSVPLDPAATVLGNKALQTIQFEGEEKVILLEQVRGDHLSDWKAKYKLEADTETDARVLAILRKGDERFRVYRDACDKWQQVSFADWKVSGPRTVA